MLSEQSVLRVSPHRDIIEMLHPDELRKDSAGVSKTYVLKVALSWNGDTLFVITLKASGNRAALKAWDISSGMFKPGERVLKWAGSFAEFVNLVALRDGVLLQTSDDILELWNFELSECIRSWTDLGYIRKVIPISEERVACEVLFVVKHGIERKVIIVDATREGILSTIPIHGIFVACNSKCHVITSDRSELQMQCGDVVLWKISTPYKAFFIYERGTFSPTEQYCVVGVFKVLYVLDVVLGKTLRTLQPGTHEHWNPVALGCGFVSDEECVAFFKDEFDDTRGNFLQLFNIKSGDLLSEITFESAVYDLAACPRERLIAIYFYEPDFNFKVLQVKLPGDKHNRKSKR